jgi:hypothetical protein
MAGAKGRKTPASFIALDWRYTSCEVNDKVAGSSLLGAAGPETSPGRLIGWDGRR